MRRLARVALALAIALPACAQRGAHGGFAGRSAPAPAFHSAPSFRSAPAFHSAPSFSARAPQSFRSAPSFSAPQGFRSAPAYSRPQAFRGAPSISRYYAGAPAHNGYSPIGIHPVPAPPVRYPHGYGVNRPVNHPTFFRPDHDRVFFNPGFGLLAYPALVGPGFWPYDLSFYGGYDPWYGDDGYGSYGSYSGFQDPPYNDPVYNNLSNDGLAPTASAYYNQSAPAAPPPAAEPAPAPAPGPEMQYVPGSADTVTLIFRDGRPPEEIHNFIATRSTLTVLDGRRRRDIPIADLDLAATLKANRETGVDFQLPATR